MTRTSRPVSQTGTLPAAPAHLPWRNAGLAMAVIFSGLQMLNEVGSMMAIPLYQSMSADLGLSASQVAWALTATTLMGAASTALLAKAGDRYGHRRLLLACTATIVIGFVIAATATSFPVLILGRALVGITATQALVIGIMNKWLSGVDRKRAIGILAGGQAVGVTLGFGIGGLMVAVGASWRMAFWLGAILTAIGLLATWRWTPADAVKPVAVDEPPLRYGAVLLMGSSLTALCIGISQSSTWGFGSPQTIAFCALGIVGLVASVAWEARSDHPLVEIGTLLSRRLMPAYSVFISLSICAMMLYNLVMGWAQTPPVAGYGFGMTPLVAGFLFLPMTLAGIIAGRWVPRALRHVPPRKLLIAATCTFTVVFTWIFFLHSNVLATLVAIFVFGLAYSTILTIAVSVISSAATETTGAGTASIYVSVALASGSIGAAIYSTVMGLGVTPTSPMVSSDNFGIGFIVCGVASLIGVGSALALSKSVVLDESDVMAA